MVDVGYVVEAEFVKVGCLEGTRMRVAEVNQRVASVGDERYYNVLWMDVKVWIIIYLY